MAKNIDPADFTEDGSSIESLGTGTSRISSVGPSGDYEQADFSNYDTHKSFGKNTAPLQCRNSKAHKGRLSIIAPTLTGSDKPTPMCSTCWDKIKTDTSKYEPSPIILHNDPAQRASMRADLAKIEATGRSRDAAKVHEVTGQEIIVQGPGRRPRISTKVDLTAETGRGTKREAADIEADEWIKQEEARRRQESGADALSTTLRRSDTSGGRNQGPDHEELLDKAHKAVVSSIKNGNIDPDKYHSAAAAQGLDHQTALKYFPFAINKHRQMTKSSVIRPEKYTLTGTFESDPVQSTTEEGIQNLMESSIPTSKETKGF